MKKWFVRLYIPIMMAIVTAGMISVLVFGYHPAPALVIKPSPFERPEQIGAVLFHRFYSEIHSRNLIAFGVPPQPDWHREIVQGLLRAAAGEGLGFAAVIAEAQMPPLDLSHMPNVRVVTIPTNSPTQSELIETLTSLKDKRVLLYLPSVYSSHVMGGNVINRLEMAIGESIFAISSGPLALRHDQEYLVEPQCVGSERDQRGTSKLGCVILKSGRQFYRKQIPQDRWIAVMNSSRPDDYLLMVSTPGQDIASHSEANRKLREQAPGPLKGM